MKYNPSMKHLPFRNFLEITHYWIPSVAKAMAGRPDIFTALKIPG
jgi:hypothetical protein